MQSLPKLFSSATTSGEIYIAPGGFCDTSLVVPTGTFTGNIQLEFRRSQAEGPRPVALNAYTSIAAAAPQGMRVHTFVGGWFRWNCTSFTGNNILATLTDARDSDTPAILKWVDIPVTAAVLDGAGQAVVMPPIGGRIWKVRNVRLVGGGVNYAAGGDRLISLTDGTTVYTTIANADIESAPAATLDWGNTKVPFLTGVSDTVTVAGAALRFQYSGGTTDHSATGSINFSVCLEKIA